MDIWRSAEETCGTALSALIARAGDVGCTVVPRILSTASPTDDEGGAPVSPLLLWVETEEIDARTAALRSGVDEVIGPWMHSDEALARLLRLATADRQIASRLVLGTLDIDLIDHKVRREDKPLDLLRREYEILVFLARIAAASSRARRCSARSGDWPSTPAPTSCRSISPACAPSWIAALPGLCCKRCGDRAII